MEDNAAHALEGLVLKDKWKVIRKLTPGASATGGFFSVSYIVSDGENEAFLKALNFKAFFSLFKGKSVIEILNEQTNAYKYEKELLVRCRNNKLSKVSMILDEGEEFVEGYTISNVPYLIFEMAEGDIRSKISFNNAIESVWKLRSLHNVAVGLKQLHYINIGHQDLKPSNVLLYNNSFTSKIGDLGRSLCSEIAAPHENGGNFAGDFTYAPPEFLYKYIEPEWDKRVKATDMYLFGSLIVFYYTGTNMTASIGKNIDPAFRWGSWGGSFEDVKDYLIEGFYKSLKEFKNSIHREELGLELYNIVEICCFPYPNKRGHPKSFNRQFSNQYDFDRIISKLDILIRQEEYNINHGSYIRNKGTKSNS
ncbi:MAG: serine/threonine-protein kinase [Bacteroidota bacterium]